MTEAWHGPIGDLVARREGGTVRILSADAHILISLELCEQLLFRPTRYARIEIKSNCTQECRPGNHPCAEQRPMRLVHFADDYGHSYVYTLGQYRNTNGFEAFEAHWPD